MKNPDTLFQFLAGFLAGGAYVILSRRMNARLVGGLNAQEVEIRTSPKRLTAGFLVRFTLLAGAFFVSLVVFKNQISVALWIGFLAVYHFYLVYLSIWFYRGRTRKMQKEV